MTHIPSQAPDEAGVVERLRSSAKAFRENPIYSQDGDPVYLRVQADELDEAANLIEKLALSRPPVREVARPPILENGSASPPPVVEEGDPEADLIGRFSAALLAKVQAAEAKYDWRRAWMRDDWGDELPAKLDQHVHKGDPIDVAIYAAFAWHHGWSVAPTPPAGEEAVERVGRAVMDWATPHLKHIVSFNVLCDAIRTAFPTRVLTIPDELRELFTAAEDTTLDDNARRVALLKFNQSVRAFVRQVLSNQEPSK